MKALSEFTKSTLVGGLLVVVPIYCSVLLLAKALAGLIGLLGPVTRSCRSPCTGCASRSPC